MEKGATGGVFLPEDQAIYELLKGGMRGPPQAPAVVPAKTVNRASAYPCQPKRVRREARWSALVTPSTTKCKLPFLHVSHFDFVHPENADIFPHSNQLTN